MASPSISSTVNFVKKYPITLCGFSLLFMPSVHRLLLYFTPLLLSTAIFIVAMLSWGPSMSSAAERGKRRGDQWAFNGSLKIYEEAEEEEEEEEEGPEEVEEVAEADPQRKVTSEAIMQQENVSIKGKASKNQLEPKLQEPDPDFDEERDRIGTASNSAEPDPDLSGGCVGAVSNRCQAEPQPDLSGDCVGTASSGAISGGEAEPDPDLHGERVGPTCSAEADALGDCVGTASYDDPAEPDPDLHGEQDVEDQDFTAAQHLHATADHHHHHLPASHDDHSHSTEPALVINPDQLAAGDHLDYHDAAPDHPNYDDGDQLYHGDHDDSETKHLDYHDAESDPDLHGEVGAVHAKSEGAHDDLHAAIAELRQKLGVMKRSPYNDDARDMHSQQLAERSQTLRAAA